MEASSLTFAVVQAVIFVALGLPLGVPPQGQDIVVERVAPQECLFYATWAGMGSADAASENHTEKLLANKEIRHLFNVFKEKIGGATKMLAAFNPDPKAQEAVDLLPKWGELLLTRPVAFYISKLGVNQEEEKINVQGGMVIRLDADGPKVKAALEQLQEKSIGEAVKAVNIDKQQYYQFQIHPAAPPVTWGVRGNYLVAGIGENAVEDLYKNVKQNTASDGTTRLPKWLAAVRNQSAVKRVSTITYADIRKMIEIGASLGGGPDAQKMIESFEVGHLTTYASVTGLDDTGFVSQQFMGVAGEPTGLLKLASGLPLSTDDIKNIPSDATVALAFRLDPVQAVDSIVEVVSSIDAVDGEKMKNNIDTAGRLLEVDIRDELLLALGNVAYLHASQSEGGVLTGWTAAIQIRDRAKLNQVHEKLLLFAKRASEANQAEVKSFEFAGQKCYFFQPAEEAPVLPTWCIAEKEIVVGLFPHAVKAHLAVRPDDKRLVDRPEVSRWFNDASGPIAMYYFDTPKFFEYMYSFLQVAATVGISQASKLGIELDHTLMPSAPAVNKHLQPSVGVVARTKDGISMVNHQTLPNASAGVAVPLLAATVLPAVQSARKAAKRTASSNNLRQIGVTMHNFHEVYRSLPVAYNVDDNNKPLLSWRVHILPFIDPQAARQLQFRTREPWDSEHNKKLIEKMPAVFRSPQSKAPPGMTVYRAIGGPNGVIVPATRRSQIGGTSFDKITDGTSNTILVVEANDESAVIWTKPDEFVPDKDDPLKGILGLYPDGFNALFGDASIRFLPASIDKKLLQNLFQRNDGQQVEIP